MPPQAEEVLGSGGGPGSRKREHTRVSKCVCRAEAVRGAGTGENKVDWGSCDRVLGREVCWNV